MKAPVTTPVRHKVRNKRPGSGAGRKKPAEPVAWTAAAGLDDWAAWERIHPDTTLAAVSALLAGTAGAGWVMLPDGPLKLPKLDLILPDPCSREARAVGRLAESVELLNQRLAGSMAGFCPAVLNQLDLGAAEGPTNRNPASSGTLARHRRVLLPETASEDLLGADLEVDVRQARREAITRPAFLLSHPRPAEIRTLVGECHRGTALAAPFPFPTIHHPSQTIRNGNEIAELLGGRLCRGREGTRVSAPGRLRLHAIFTPDQEAFARLPDLAPLLLDRCLVIEPPAPAETAGVPMAGRHRFAEAFRAPLAVVLNTRRQGHDPTFPLLSPEASALFETELRDYELECDLLPAEPGVSARGLPVSLSWAMGMLARQLPPSKGLDETVMVRTAFAVSRQLLARHAVTTRRLRAAGVVAEKMKLATRIAAEVAAHPPLRQRQLRRSFDDQRKQRFDPVFAALEAAGVIEREGKWSLVPGPVAFEKVREALERRFADAEIGDDGQEDGQAGAESSVSPPLTKGKGRPPKKAVIRDASTAFTASSSGHPPATGTGKSAIPNCNNPHPNNDEP